MSFMFNPYPYDDPHASNIIDPEGLELDKITEGSEAAALSAAEEILHKVGETGRCVAAVDGYTAAPIDVFVNRTAASCKECGKYFVCYGRALD